MEKWGIIGAMDSEVTQLIAAMTNVRTEEHAGRTYYEGTLGNRQVVVLKCGIGKVAAAIGAQVLCDLYHVTALINTGVAGGLHPALAVGDIVLGTTAVQHDFDVTAFGYVRGYMCTGEDGQKPTVYTADAGLAERFYAAAAPLLGDSKVIEGPVATGDLFVDSGEIKQRLIAEFGAAAAEMEGGAIAQTATANGVPFLLVRAISDLADHQANVSYEEFEQMAADRSAAILLAMTQQ